MTTRNRPAAFRTINEASDWVIDQFISQLREARAEHNIAAAKVRAEFNSRVADFRNELFAKYDADVARLSETIAQLKAKYEKEVTTLQRELAEARAEVSKLRTAKCERSETTGLN